MVIKRHAFFFTSQLSLSWTFLMNNTAFWAKTQTQRSNGEVIMFLIANQSAYVAPIETQQAVTN